MSTCNNLKVEVTESVIITNGGVGATIKDKLLDELCDLDQSLALVSACGKVFVASEMVNHSGLC